MLHNDGRYEFTNSFLLLKNDDERCKEFSEIKKETGISPDETWSLDYSIAVFVLPRLKMFKDITVGHPNFLTDMNEWYEILDSMIWSFERVVNVEIDHPYADWQGNSEEYFKKLDYGFELFGRYYLNLWW